MKTPDSYEPDIPEKVIVEQVMDDMGLILSADNSIEETIEWLESEPDDKSNDFIVSDNEGEYIGIISYSQSYNKIKRPETKLETLIKPNVVSVENSHSLRTAIEIMANEKIDVIPVLSNENKHSFGILSYANIIASYKLNLEDDQRNSPHISLKR